MSTSTNRPIRFCHRCGEDREFDRECRRETARIRNEEVQADIPVLVCRECDETQLDDESGIDPLLLYYEKYRQRHNMLTPNEIRALREQYGLSREALAAVVGMSPATLYRYENGALQDLLHDSLFVLCQEKTGIERLIERRKQNLSQAQLHRYRHAIGKRNAKPERTERAFGLLRNRPALWAHHVAA